MSWEDYLKNRAFRGEKPHLVAARITGSDASQFNKGEVEPVTTETNGREVLDIDDDLTKTSPAIAATAVIFPQELWGKITELAAIEFRTPEQQVLYMLDGLLNPISRTRMVNEISNRSLEERILLLINTSPAIQTVLKG